MLSSGVIHNTPELNMIQCRSVFAGYQHAVHDFGEVPLCACRIYICGGSDAVFPTGGFSVAVGMELPEVWAVECFEEFLCDGRSFRERYLEGIGPLLFLLRLGAPKVSRQCCGEILFCNAHLQ